MEGLTTSWTTGQKIVAAPYVVGAGMSVRVPLRKGKYWFVSKFWCGPNMASGVTKYNGVTILTWDTYATSNQDCLYNVSVTLTANTAGQFYMMTTGYNPSNTGGIYQLYFNYIQITAYQ